jgi:LasA protease
MNLNFKKAPQIVLIFFVTVLLLVGVLNAPSKIALAQGNQDDETILMSKAKSVAQVYLAVDAKRIIIADLQINDAWATGHIIVTAVGNGGPDLLLLIGKKSLLGWAVTIDGQTEYSTWAKSLPSELKSPEIESSQFEIQTIKGASAWVEQPELAFPWTAGQTWKFTGGPHTNSGKAGRPWSSLDFSPYGTASWFVRASAPGVVSYSTACLNFVKITHTNGWQTGYYHLSGILVKNGQTVAKGTILGKASTLHGCGGSATGAHVHFSLRKSGVYQEWNNRYIGAYYVRDGTAQYKGCLQRVNDSKKFCQWTLVSNTGAVGLGIPGTPVLVSPTGVISVNNVTFKWNATYAVVNYRIQIATDATFATPLVSALTGTQASYSITMLNDGTYYWRVRGENFSNLGPWAVTGSFIKRTITSTPTSTATVTATSVIVPSTYTPTPTETTTETPTPTLTATVTPTPTPTSIVTPAPIIIEAVLTPPYGTCSATSWIRLTGGNGGTYIYLTLNTNVPANSTNSGKWTPNLPIPGQYKVEAFVAYHGQVTWPCAPSGTIGWDTSDARYKVYSGGSLVQTVTVDQKPLSNQWANLGTYSFQAGTNNYVILTDLNGEAQLTRTVSYNVVKFTYVGP